MLDQALLWNLALDFRRAVSVHVFGEMNKTLRLERIPFRQRRELSN